MNLILLDHLTPLEINFIIFFGPSVSTQIPLLIRGLTTHSLHFKKAFKINISSPELIWKLFFNGSSLIYSSLLNADAAPFKLIGIPRLANPTDRTVIACDAILEKNGVIFSTK